MLPRDFAHQAFTGPLTPEVVEQEVLRHWGQGRFLFHLGPSAVPRLGPAQAMGTRYASTDGLGTELLFGREGHGGCLVITTPPCAEVDESLARLLVPPHIHVSHHVALMLEGEARFLVARPTRNGPVLIDEPVSRGTLIFCPADAPHTFITRRGFRVASLHARYLGHERDDFASDSPLDFSGLPRLDYDGFRRSAAPALGPSLSAVSPA